MRSDTFRKAITMNMGTFHLQVFLNNLNREVEKLHAEKDGVSDDNVIRINLLEDIIESLEFYVE